MKFKPNLVKASVAKHQGFLGCFAFETPVCTKVNCGSLGRVNFGIRISNATRT